MSLVLTATAAWKLVPQPIRMSRLQRLTSLRWSFSPPSITEEVVKYNGSTVTITVIVLYDLSYFTYVNLSCRVMDRTDKHMFI